MGRHMQVKVLRDLVAEAEHIGADEIAGHKFSPPSQYVLSILAGYIEESIPRIVIETVLAMEEGEENYEQAICPECKSPECLELLSPCEGMHGLEWGDNEFLASWDGHTDMDEFQYPYCQRCDIELRLPIVTLDGLTPPISFL